MLDDLSCPALVIVNRNKLIENNVILYCRPLLQIAFQNLAVVNSVSDDEWQLSLASGEEVVLNAVNTTEVFIKSAATVYSKESKNHKVQLHHISASYSGLKKDMGIIGCLFC